VSDADSAFTAPTALVPFLSGGDEGTDAWVRIHRSDRRRLAIEAARDKDTTALLSLTEAWLRTYSTAGATIAKGTVENHKHGVRKLLAAWREEDLLKPDAEAANRYVRMMERQGLKPGTIYGRVAAARALYRALRWARASLYDPFADVHVPHDPTPPWEKRKPYDSDEIVALLDSAADPFDRVLVLLGAHGGLRAGECVRLRWRDVNMARRDLIIRVSKGGKTRTVGMSASLRQALHGLPRRPDGYVLPYRTPKTAWAHVTALCESVSANVLGRGQTPEHEMDHRDIDHGFAARGQFFIILAQATIAPEPTKGALDNPALGQHDEALLVVGALDDLQDAAQERLGPNDQASTVGVISPDFAQAGEAPLHPC